MKVFVSWSGDMSRAVAEILRKHLPNMIQSLKVFMSKSDLESGARWSVDLSRELEETSFGIICLTPGNLKEPWILFEAGALTKHIQGRACGLLLADLSPTDITGPLSQFQNRRFTKDEFRHLISDINQRLPDPLEDQSLEIISEKWWPDIESEYKTVLSSTDSSLEKPQSRSTTDLLEEILTRVRGLERSIGGSAKGARMIRPRPEDLDTETVEGFYVELLNDQQRRLLKYIARETSKGPGLTVETLPTPFSRDDLDLLTSISFVRVSKYPRAEHVALILPPIGGLGGRHLEI